MSNSPNSASIAGVQAVETSQSGTANTGQGVDVVTFDPATMVDASAYGLSSTSTDNASAIEAAQAAALAQNKKLYFEPGHYVVGSMISLQSNEHWLATQGTVTLQAAASDGRLLGLAGNPGTGSQAPTAISDDSLIGFTFDGATSGMPNDVALITTWIANNIEISHCTIENVNGVGILLSNTQNSTISDCALSNIGNSPAITHNTGTASQGIAFCGDDVIQSIGNTVERSTFTGIGLDAISAGNQTNFVAIDNVMLHLNVLPGWENAGAGAAGIYLAQTNGAKVSGNTIEGASGNGIDAYRDDNILISDNHVSGSYEAGLALWDMANTQVSGNAFVDNNQLLDHFPHTAGISIGGDSLGPSDYNVAINGNVIADDQTSATQDWGVQVDRGTPLSDVSVSSDNLFFGNRNGAITPVSSGPNTGLALVASGAQFRIDAEDPAVEAIIQRLLNEAETAPASGVQMLSGADVGGTTSVASALFILPATSGSLSLSGNAGIILIDHGSSMTISGSATTVVGDSFAFSGSAKLIASGGGFAHIADSADDAAMIIGAAGSAQIVASGLDQTISIGLGGRATVNSSGGGASINAGAGSSTVLQENGTGDVISIASDAASTLIGAQTSLGGYAGGLSPAPTGMVGSGSKPALVLVSLGNADSVSASGNFAVTSSDADVIRSTSNTLSLSITGSTASTIVGGQGNTSVTALTGEVFEVGSTGASSNHNTFFGQAGTSTIIAGAGGGVFVGGSGGALFQVGTSNSQIFVGTGGSDTISGIQGAVSPTIYASGAEHMLFTETAPEVTIFALAGEPASHGVDALINMALTQGGNEIVAGFGATGNETLIGSTGQAGGSRPAAGDHFVLGSASLGNPGMPTDPANITIENWHSGDDLQLVGFTAADSTALSETLSTTAVGGTTDRLAVTLSDRTVITFMGNHPLSFATTSNWPN